MRELLVGDHLDQYQITDLLARSGMASVYRARDTENGASVALKVPYMQFESDVVFHERFRREEELGQRLDHPSIIKFLRPREKSRMYIAMELVEGTSLRALLEPRRAISVERALDIAKKLCEALVYLHGRRVVHRDLKPENVLVLPDGRIKLLDFGIALDESARRLTWFGLSATVGTPDYMAPEQIGGRRGDVRTDVYALGTMLYEMLTGHLPYASSNAVGMVRAKKTHEAPQPPTRYVPGLDPHLEEILLRAIEPSPRDRYPTAAAMLEDLRDPSRVLPGARAVSPARRGLAALPVPRSVLGALLILAILAGLVLLTWLSHRSAPPAAPPGPAGHGALG
jgi:serine/threonine protein kinase